MLRYCYKNDEELVQLFKVLDIQVDPEKPEFYKLNEILINTSFDDSLKIFADVLEIDDFWLTESELIELNNNHIKSINRIQSFTAIGSLTRIPLPLDYSPPYYKNWGLELVNLLQSKCGILYDRSAKAFSFVGVSDLKILT